MEVLGENVSFQSKTDHVVKEKNTANFYQIITVFFNRSPIPNELADTYRYYQFCAIVRLLPLAGVATYSSVGLALFFAWSSVNNSFLLVWSILLTMIATSELIMWWVYIIRDPDNSRHVSKKMVYFLALKMSVAGILYAALVIHLFSLFTDYERIFLFSIISAFISSGGWMFASIPLVGLMWTISVSAGLIFGLLYFFGDTYLLLAVLAALYCTFLCFVIIISSRQYLEGLMAETKIENQHQTVSLLLNDFEEKASDWLWETNKKGHLRHLSQKLIEATDTDADRLLTLTYIDIIESLLATNETNSATQFKKMTRALTTNSDFSSIVIPVNLGNETRWWSFSAKILLDKDKKFNGLRGVTSDITSVILREREMIKQANTDTLTKIGNRHFFNEQLLLLCSESVNHHSPCALMLLDLDNFKMINDAFGHAAGDGLLVEASKRLKENTPQGAILARLGGDEFAIIVPNASGQSIMRALSEKIKYTISEPWHYGENQIEIRTSIGIAFTNQNIGSIEMLLRASDLALYAAKEAGRDAICFFDPAMEETANHKSQVLSEMRKSISDNEFVLHYQPQLDLITGKLIGFEALVRWQHPKRGLITPIHFISIAEESGLIIPLGIWVLEQACFEAKKWLSDLYVAVNVSYIQIERTDFLAEVKSVLHNTQLPPHRLEIEITESVLMTDQTPAFQFLMGLKEMGVKIALDDFGTGFSSLSYLQNLPLDKIKIDQSFINLSDTDDKTCAIIRSITQLADALELETIAEGIEREGQYKLLSDLGVKSGQGYLYARPMQVDDLPFFIESKRKLP